MEKEARIILMLILYFILLTFLVTIINGVATSFSLDANGYNSSGGGLFVDNYQVGAGNPRLGSSADFGRDSFLSSRVLTDKSAIPLMRAGYIVDKDTCEEYVGFEWKPWATFFGFTIGAETCRGYIDHTYYDPTGTWDAGNAFSTYSRDNICDLPLLSTDKELSDAFGCTWYDGTINTNIDIFDTQGVFSNIWASLQQIFTLKLSFGISNTQLNTLVNFMIVGFPVLILLIYLIILGRKIIGIT